MNLRDGILAVRSSAAMSRLHHVHMVRIRGGGAFDAIDRIFTRDLYLRDGQMIHGLLLDEEARVFADCYLASDDQEFFLLGEGPDKHELLDYLRRHAAAFADVEILDAGEGHRLIGLDGPYAWELLARLVGQEVVGLPYLTFFFFEELLCCRAGKTGEFGYVIIAPEHTAGRQQKDVVEEDRRRRRDGEDGAAANAAPHRGGPWLCRRDHQASRSRR